MVSIEDKKLSEALREFLKINPTFDESKTRKNLVKSQLVDEFMLMEGNRLVLTIISTENIKEIKVENGYIKSLKTGEINFDPIIDYLRLRKEEYWTNIPI